MDALEERQLTVTETANPFTDARASALIAKEVAREVLDQLQATHGSTHLTVGGVEPVSGTFPQHPLDTAVRDLAVATLAASRLADRAAHGGEAETARVAGEAAHLATRTLSLAQYVASSAELRSRAVERVRMAHAAASTAHAGAKLLDSRSVVSAATEVTPFPASWRHLIELLGAAITTCTQLVEGDEQRSLVSAAAAGRDGADAARRAYERLGRVTTASQTICRFVRISALAAAYAGCAALVPLQPHEAGTAAGSSPHAT